MNLFWRQFHKKRIFMDQAGGKDNPSGIHKEGVEAKLKLEDARRKIARILKCQARDVIFTSGGTESDNTVILGVPKENNRGHIIISDQEHPAVLEAAREAERRGSELSILPASEIVKNIRENTVLVSVAYVVSETGAIQDVPKIARGVREYRKKAETKYPYIHTDATQAFEHRLCDVSRLNVDLMTIDNVLVVRSGAEIRPLLFGGGQERGLRSGTENVKAIAETAQYFEDVEEIREDLCMKLAGVKSIFLAEVSRLLPQAIINTPNESVPNIVSLTFPGKLHEFLAIQLDEAGVAVSTGSSCDSSKNEPDKEALRFSFGKETTERDAREAVRILSRIMLK